MYCPSQNTPHDEELPCQTINKKLCDGTVIAGYGKAGHGMNGRDADLGRIGQCLVTELVTVDPIGADEMRVDIHLRLYATICAPSPESLDCYRANLSQDTKDYLGDRVEDDEALLGYLVEQAESIVCGMGSVGGFMWEGDSWVGEEEDVWVGGEDVTLSVPLTLDEYEEIECGEAEALETLDAVAARIYNEICNANEGGTPEREKLKRFEEEVGLANDMINGIR